MIPSAGLSNASINRRCAALRRALVLGVRAGKVYGVPYIPRLKEHSPRGRYLPRLTPPPLEDTYRITCGLSTPSRTTTAPARVSLLGRSGASSTGNAA